MRKQITFTLKEIKYNGKSIGDDIQIDIELEGKEISQKKKIKFGSTTQINKEITNLETSDESFISNIKIQIFEDDLLFDDVGTIESKIKVNLTKEGSQNSTFKVEIDEKRSTTDPKWGENKAIFDLVIEARVKFETEYIGKDSGEDGWLATRIDGFDEPISLPIYTKVKFEKVENGREYFIIQEGFYRGKKASSDLLGSVTYLTKGFEHTEGISATYSISKKLFSVNGKKYRTTDYKEAPWQKGLYDIEMPDYPHELGRNVNVENSITWFRVGHSGDRYLHAGSSSLGCITVIEKDRWTEIYSILILARKGDFRSVGLIKVID